MGDPCGNYERAFTPLRRGDANRNVRAGFPRQVSPMRLIIPIILIALMLPYATGEDEPTGEWLIPPDPTMGVVATANAAGRTPGAATQPATRPAAGACVIPRPRR